MIASGIPPADELATTAILFVHDLVGWAVLLMGLLLAGRVLFESWVSGNRRITDRFHDGSDARATVPRKGTTP